MKTLPLTNENHILLKFSLQHATQLSTHTPAQSADSHVPNNTANALTTTLHYHDN